MTLTQHDVRQLAETHPSLRLQQRLSEWRFNQPEYAEWVTLLEDCLQHQFSFLSQRRNQLAGSSEDQITTGVLLGLYNLGLDATSEMVNGNCDVTIRFSDYVWLGEAKLDGGVSKVWGGYKQLTQRYSTGLPNQSSGGMLIYCFEHVALEFMTSWKAALEIDEPGANTRDQVALRFRSSAVSTSSGLPLEIVHIGVPLRHAPEDADARLSSAALKAARDAKKP